MIRPMLQPLSAVSAAEPLSPDLMSVLCGLVPLIGIAVLFVWRMLKALHSKSTDRYIPACLVLTVSVGLFSFLAFGVSVGMAKGLILFCILLYASVSDIRKREVPDFVWIMLGILALADFESAKLPSMLVGAAAVFLPQFVLAMVRPDRAVGGADIKISTAAAFLLGAEKGILALIVGLAVAVVVMSIRCKVKKGGKSEAFPLVPYLALGIMTAYLI